MHAAARLQKQLAEQYRPRAHQQLFPVVCHYGRALIDFVKIQLDRNMPELAQQPLACVLAAMAAKALAPLRLQPGQAAANYHETDRDATKAECRSVTTGKQPEDQTSVRQECGFQYRAAHRLPDLHQAHPLTRGLLVLAEHEKEFGMYKLPGQQVDAGELHQLPHNSALEKS